MAACPYTVVNALWQEILFLILLASWRFIKISQKVFMKLYLEASKKAKRSSLLVIFTFNSHTQKFKTLKNLGKNNLFSACFVLLSFSFVISKATAQIVPDATVNTTVTQQGNTRVISGGTRAGGNLFHSFSSFSIPTGTEAFFNNAADLQNIINRVTGGSISNIDGLIRANGIANLFLINPNGIIVGPNASLNIGGSFLASTADSVIFADGSQFSAIDAQTKPLLTVSVPIGLQMGSSPGQIVNRSSALAIAPDIGSPIPVGLQVYPGRTLALLGGDVVLENGFLTSPGGRIELGSVRDGFVSLTPYISGFALGYQGVSTYGDIQLSGQSTVNASGLRGGDIQVQGRRVTLTDKANIASFTLGQLDGGNLTVNASESVELTGNGGLEQTLRQLIGGNFSPTEQRNGLFAPSFGEGSAGNVTINTRSFIARNGAMVLTSTLASGAGGHLTVNATDNVELSGSALLTGSRNEGNAGNLTINTNQLIVRQGLAATSSFGTGRSGDLTVNASLVELDGNGVREIIPISIENVVIAPGLNTSGILSGDAGNLTITTARLIVRDGAAIGATTTGSGKGGTLTVNATDSVELSSFERGLTVSTGGSGAGGDLNINTRRLTIKDGAGADASTFGPGEGGTLTVNASELIELIGNKAASDAQNGGLATRSLNSPTRSLNSPTRSLKSGNAGNLQIKTKRLIIRDGAIISVGSVNEGNAGNLDIKAVAIELDNQGKIFGETTAGQANITLRSHSLILRRGSRINTNATGSKNPGGNITINTNVLAALENSDISANSQKFQGGTVTINSRGIFGAEFRQVATPESDITATGGTPDLSGTVTVNTPDIDPTSGLVQLPDNPVDATTLVASTCRGGSQQSEFIVTGRGGLPPNPNEAIDDEATWIDLRPSIGEQGSRGAGEQGSQEAGNNDRLATTIPQITEAQGWVINSQGKVELVARSPLATPHNPTLSQQQCHEK